MGARPRFTAISPRFIALSPEILGQIQALSLEELENLGEALLDFSAAEDLTNWLNQRQP